MQSFVDRFGPFIWWAIMLACFVAAALLLWYLARLVFSGRVRPAGNSRGRLPRLGVVDAYDLDRQRQLVLIRRDNVEHLVMIGGPNDVLIESSIAQTAARTASGPEMRGIRAMPGGQEDVPPILPPPLEPAMSSPPAPAVVEAPQPRRPAPQPSAVQPPAPQPPTRPAAAEPPPQRRVATQPPPPPIPAQAAPEPVEPVAEEPPPVTRPQPEPARPAPMTARPPLGEAGGQRKANFDFYKLTPRPTGSRPVGAPPPARAPVEPKPETPPSPPPAPASESPPPAASEELESKPANGDAFELDSEIAKLLGRPIEDGKN